MGYKQDTALTEVVPLSAGYEATIQVYRGKGSEDIQNALLGGARALQRFTGQDQKSAAVEQQVDGNALQRRTIVNGVASWTCSGDPEPEGTVWPIDEKHVMELTAPDRAKLFTAIQKLNSPLDPDSDSSG